MENPDLVCFQETKIDDMNYNIVREVCGRKFDKYKSLDATGTRGGILIAWSSRKFTITDMNTRVYTISVFLKFNKSGESFCFTGIYGPANRSMRHLFFEEMKEVKPTSTLPWLLCGDFNNTLPGNERNNPNADWRGSVRFARLLTDMGLININMHGRQFTWNNDRESPSMARLDRFLFSTEWNNKYPNSQQSALPNTSSDHCPVLYTATTNFKKTNVFRFENMWLKNQDLEEVVSNAWNTNQPAHTPKQLHDKLMATQRQIRIWAKEKVGHIKKQIKACREYMGWTDRVREVRNLTELEKFINCIIKKRYTDLAVLEEELWKQRAKLRWNKEGDKNTHYFHAVASASKRTNNISQIEVNDNTISDQKGK
ncbi:uncharacterized protein LOC144551855 [Carex rostrata]